MTNSNQEQQQGNQRQVHGAAVKDANSTSLSHGQEDTMNFFSTKPSSRGDDVAAMNDVQFTASLDALLNGEGLTGFSDQYDTSGLPASLPSHFAISGESTLPSLPSPQGAASNAAAPVHAATNRTLAAAAPQTTLGHSIGMNQTPIAPTPAGSHSGAPQQSTVQDAQVAAAAGPAAAQRAPVQVVSRPTQVASHPGQVASQPRQVAPHPGQVTSQQAASTLFQQPQVISGQMRPPAIQVHGVNPWTDVSRNVVVPMMFGQAAAAPIASAQHIPSTTGTKMKHAKRKAKDVVWHVSEDESERDKRRRDRNVREQQRSHRITEQIAHLRGVLSEANIPFKPDKYSTLTKVVEYVKALQDRSAVLDAEHTKLLSTISKTNEMVNESYVPQAYDKKSKRINNDLLADDSDASLEDDLVFVKNIEFKALFTSCSVALALASIDGRFLDCNKAFEELTTYDRAELLPLELIEKSKEANSGAQANGQEKRNLSLFNLLSREGMEKVFSAMSEMLKQPIEAQGKLSALEQLQDFWSGPVTLGRLPESKVRLNVTLVRTTRGRPKFFNCALSISDEGK